MNNSAWRCPAGEAQAGLHLTERGRWIIGLCGGALRLPLRCSLKNFNPQPFEAQFLVDTLDAPSPAATVCVFMSHTIKKAPDPVNFNNIEVF